MLHMEKPEWMLDDIEEFLNSRGYSKNEKNKVLFATTNPAKVKKYKDELKKRNIELLTLEELGINQKIEEIGKNAIENAKIKAKEYYELAQIPTIGMDNCLFIEELPEEKQPGTHVRRVNGNELNDEEMIEYYTNLVKENGGKLTAKWIFGMAFYNGTKMNELSWNKSNFYLIDKPCEKRNPGYPLDSISVLPEKNKYFVELTQDEILNSNKEKSVVEVAAFIENSLNENQS